MWLEVVREILLNAEDAKVSQKAQKEYQKNVSEGH
jgi:hypothetical protein